MAGINSIDLNSGVTMRAQDMTILKANEDRKPFVEQFDLQVKTERQNEENQGKVKETEETEAENFRFDAREEGKNQYEDRRKKREHSEEEEETTNVFMEKTEGGSFDVSI